MATKDKKPTNSAKNTKVNTKVKKTSVVRKPVLKAKKKPEFEMQSRIVGTENFKPEDFKLASNLTWNVQAQTKSGGFLQVSTQRVYELLNNLKIINNKSRDLIDRIFAEGLNMKPSDIDEAGAPIEGAKYQLEDALQQLDYEILRTGDIADKLNSLA